MQHSLIQVGLHYHLFLGDRIQDIYFRIIHLTMYFGKKKKNNKIISTLKRVGLKILSSNSMNTNLP